MSKLWWLWRGKGKDRRQGLGLIWERDLGGSVSWSCTPQILPYSKPMRSSQDLLLSHDIFLDFPWVLLALCHIPHMHNHHIGTWVCLSPGEKLLLEGEWWDESDHDRLGSLQVTDLSPQWETGPGQQNNPCLQTLPSLTDLRRIYKYSRMCPHTLSSFRLSNFISQNIIFSPWKAPQ